MPRSNQKSLTYKPQNRQESVFEVIPNSELSLPVPSNIEFRHELTRYNGPQTPSTIFLNQAQQRRPSRLEPLLDRDQSRSSQSSVTRLLGDPKDQLTFNREQSGRRRSFTSSQVLDRVAREPEEVKSHSNTTNFHHILPTDRQTTHEMNLARTNSLTKQLNPGKLTRQQMQLIDDSALPVSMNARNSAKKNTATSMDAETPLLKRRKRNKNKGKLQPKLVQKLMAHALKGKTHESQIFSAVMVTHPHSVHSVFNLLRIDCTPNCSQSTKNTGLLKGRNYSLVTPARTPHLLPLCDS